MWYTTIVFTLPFSDFFLPQLSKISLKSTTTVKAGTNTIRATPWKQHTSARFRLVKYVHWSVLSNTIFGQKCRSCASCCLMSLARPKRIYNISETTLGQWTPSCAYCSRQFNTAPYEKFQHNYWNIPNIFTNIWGKYAIEVESSLHAYIYVGQITFIVH